MTAPSVLTHRENAVGVITLNRPQAGNTVDSCLALELETCVTAMAADQTVRCIILTGAGKLFCGGGDIAAMSRAINRSVYLNDLAHALHRSVEVLSTMEKPLVVLVNGPAAGAGLSLAILGDVVLACRSAHFTAAYGSVGLTPDGGMSWLLPRLVGLRKAQEIIFENRRVNASDAQAIGLVTRVVDDRSLWPDGMAVATALAAGPTQAIGMTRELLKRSYGNNLSQHLEKEATAIAAAAALPDAAEGVTAFLQRRSPRFDAQGAPGRSDDL